MRVNTFSRHKYLLTLAMLFAFSFPSLSLDKDSLIVPGERIGKISVGETTEEVHQDLGRSDSGDAAMGHSLETWLARGRGGNRDRLDIYSVRDFSRESEPLTVRQIRVTSSAFATAGGVSTGRTLSDIRRTFKGAKPVGYYVSEQGKHVYIYDDMTEGVAFEILDGRRGRLPTAKGRCIAIIVHAKGTNAIDQYIPVHPNLTRL